jgi:DNA polymerase III subunit gamma/tau
MAEYQVVPRKFRPQTFKDVVAQEAVITTLKNAIRYKRLAQAYLFCGSRGTGKTTLARLLAKALNCQNPTTEGEPCNQCSSCREITLGSSLDVLEIDGASNRGIEDIRQINENVGYAPSSGRYKIYLIDEVHMLTKDAFNALLKTLEEPPPMVKFFFATTEPHKIPATILSRCQRFNLERIPTQKIVQKLRFIAESLNTEIDDEALQLVAQRAEGGLRDAESLLDQIMAFQEGKITGESVRNILGLMPRESYFALDKAGKEGHFAKAFEIAHQVFSQGKNLIYFIEELTEHIRTILLMKCGAETANLILLPDEVKKQYQETSLLYTQEQCLSLLEYLIESQQTIRFASSGRITLESILLHVMRSHFRISVELLVQRLSHLEKSMGSFQPVTPHITATPPVIAPSQTIKDLEQIKKQEVKFTEPKHPEIKQPEAKQPEAKHHEKTTLALSNSLPIPKNPKPINEDPTPSLADLGIKSKPQSPPIVSIVAETRIEPIKKENQSHYDTLVQFAAVELKGKVQKS